MKAIEKYNKIQDLNKTEVPWKVWTCFESNDKILLNHGLEIAGSQICLGGDFKELDQVRESLEWLVDQLGGKISWDNS